MKKRAQERAILPKPITAQLPPGAHVFATDAPPRSGNAYTNFKTCVQGCYRTPRRSGSE